MSVGAILLIVLVCCLLFSFPRVGAYNAGWGMGPFGGIGLVLVIILILVLLGKI